jgi:hypothetical protein
VQAEIYISRLCTSLKKEVHFSAVKGGDLDCAEVRPMGEENANDGGLWRRHFHWSVLLKWEVFGWILAALAAVAGILLIFDQYVGANICFMLTAAFLFAKIIHVAVTANDPVWQRLLFTFVLFGLVGVGIVETVRGVIYWANKHKVETSDSILHDNVTPETAKPSVNKIEGVDQQTQPEPSVTLLAYLQPEEPYSEGTMLAGIIWQKNYVDTRLDIANGVAIKNLDFIVGLDTSIAGVGQLSQFPGITAFPVGSLPPAWLTGTDLKGNPVSIPMTPIPGTMSMAPVYRVHCSEVFANTVVHLVIASIAINSVQNGQLPQQLFAPRRLPKLIKIKGSYETQTPGAVVQNHTLEFSYQFPEIPKAPTKATVPRPTQAECRDDRLENCSRAELYDRVQKLAASIQGLVDDCDKRLTESSDEGRDLKSRLTSEKYNEWARTSRNAVVFFQHVNLGKYNDEYKPTAIKYRDELTARLGVAVRGNVDYDPGGCGFLRDVARDLSRLALLIKPPS